MNESKLMIEANIYDNSSHNIKETYSRLDLENAYMKNTNRVFDKRTLLPQQLDHLSNHVAKINEMSIHNIAFKKFATSTDNKIINDVVKVSSSQEINTVQKTIKLDQKRFGLSSDFEVDEKIKIPINIKVFSQDIKLIENQKKLENINNISQHNESNLNRSIVHQNESNLLLNDINFNKTLAHQNEYNLNTNIVQQKEANLIKNNVQPKNIFSGIAHKNEYNLNTNIVQQNEINLNKNIVQPKNLTSGIVHHNETNLNSSIIIQNETNLNRSIDIQNETKLNNNIVQNKDINIYKTFVKQNENIINKSINQQKDMNLNKNIFHNELNIIKINNQQIASNTNMKDKQLNNLFSHITTPTNMNEIKFEEDEINIKNLEKRNPISETIIIKEEKNRNVLKNEISSEYLDFNQIQQNNYIKKSEVKIKETQRVNQQNINPFAKLDLNDGWNNLHQEDKKSPKRTKTSMNNTISRTYNNSAKPRKEINNPMSKINRISSLFNAETHLFPDKIIEEQVILLENIKKNQEILHQESKNIIHEDNFLKSKNKNFELEVNNQISKSIILKTEDEIQFSKSDNRKKYNKKDFNKKKQKNQEPKETILYDEMHIIIDENRSFHRNTLDQKNFNFNATNKLENGKFSKTLQNNSVDCNDEIIVTKENHEIKQNNGQIIDNKGKQEANINIFKKVFGKSQLSYNETMKNQINSKVNEEKNSQAKVNKLFNYSQNTAKSGFMSTLRNNISAIENKSESTKLKLVEQTQAAIYVNLRDDHHLILENLETDKNNIKVEKKIITTANVIESKKEKNLERQNNIETLTNDQTYAFRFNVDEEWG